MAVERTLSIIKPDAVAKNVIGQIYARFENAGLKVVAAQMRHLTRTEAEGFYAVHHARPVFGSLTDFMSSGPAVVMVLEVEAIRPLEIIARFRSDLQYAWPGGMGGQYVFWSDADTAFVMSESRRQHMLQLSKKIYMGRRLLRRRQLKPRLPFHPQCLISLRV